MPRERPTSEQLPEQILKCTGCNGDIIAYGAKGQSFITKHLSNGTNLYYHNNGKCIFK